MPASKGNKNTSKNTRSETISRSTRAGVSFPVGRLASNLKKGNYMKRIGESAPVFLAGVLDYLVGEILELAGDATLHKKAVRITPQTIFAGIQKDENLMALFENAIISEGGYAEHIDQFILDSQKRITKSRKSKKKVGNASQAL